jgi:hypothetical protein
VERLGFASAGTQRQGEGGKNQTTLHGEGSFKRKTGTLFANGENIPPGTFVSCARFLALRIDCPHRRN